MLKPGRSDDPEAVVTRVQERLRDTYAAAQEHGLLAEDSPIHREVLTIFAEKVLEESGFNPAQIGYAFDLLGTIDQILETVRSSPQAASGEVVVRGNLGVVEYHRTGEDLRGQFTAQAARYYLKAIAQGDSGFRSRVEGERGSPDVYLKHLENEFLGTYAGAASLALAPADPLVGEKVRRCLAPDAGQIS